MAATIFYFSVQVEIGKGNADCKGCGSQWDNRQPAPVRSFAPNRFGLYDMVGNVFEWLEDCLHNNYDGAPTDGSAWTRDGNCYGHSVRGGSWFDDPGSLRPANRYWHSTGARSSGLGFRVGRHLIERLKDSRGKKRPGSTLFARSGGLCWASKPILDDS
jgi:Sulfatase-modifying factor enzyme 1